jgi:hypothetical protein
MDMSIGTDDTNMITSTSTGTEDSSSVAHAADRAALLDSSDTTVDASTAGTSIDSTSTQSSTGMNSQWRTFFGSSSAKKRRLNSE